MPRGGRSRPLRRSRRGPASGLVWLVLVVVLAIVGWGAWDLFGTEPSAKDGKATVVSVERPKPKKKREESAISQRTFVLLGVGESDGKPSLAGAMQMVFDPAQNRVAGFFVDPATFAIIPGRGLLSIKDGFAEGPKKTADAIADLVGIKAEGYLAVSDVDFQALKVSNDVPAVFAKYNDGDISRSESKALAEQMSVIPVDRRDLFDLPARELSLGETVYLEPAREELNRLVKVIWGRAPREKDDVPRVIILNGSGVPGVGRVAADRLAGKGYRVIDVKNADNFDHTTTRVLAYNKKGGKAASGIIKALRMGKVGQEAMAQDVTDVVVLLGKDFK